ncbi:hypothetical protein SOVF_041710 isoform B [Spinacia oleracea]|nr:hypothetical protein SOVF_041710 isoform B [Spinacia oleracea]
MPHYTSYKRHTSTYNYLSDIVLELLRREKRYGIQPDEDLDLLNKAEKTRIYAEYIMKDINRAYTICAVEYGSIDDRKCYCGLIVTVSNRE